MFTYRVNVGRMPRRFHTVDVDAASGLTFLIHGDVIIGVHPHSRKAQSANLTVNRLPDWCSGDMCTWVYVPLPREEKLLAFGSLVQRHSQSDWWTDVMRPCYLVCTTARTQSQTCWLKLT